MIFNICVVVSVTGSPSDELLNDLALHTRSAALLSLLEATEQRIAEMLIKTNTMRTSSRKDSVSVREPKVIRMPTDNDSVDYGEKPKGEKGFMPWRKHTRVESSYARNVCD